MKSLFIFLLSCFLISSCAVKKQWGASAGSKSDGIVRLAYSFRDMEVPETDSTQGLIVATKRCQSWGYKKAIPFDFQNQTCQQMAGLGGCVQYVVTQDYQCE